MADITELKQSARLTQDTEGNPVVQLSPQNWESLVSHIETENKHQNLLRTLLQEWAEEQEAPLIPLLPPNGTPAVRIPESLPREPAQRKPRRTPLEYTLSGYASALLHTYRWSILPLIIICVLLVNNRMYYDTFNGYDMPQHFANVFSIITTGSMPAENTVATYEAHQTPLFYVIAAWISMIGDRILGDGFQKLTTPLLLPLALVWVMLLTVMVQTMLRHIHVFLRAGTLCVIALFPMNIQTMTMFNNDLPVTLFGALAAFLMWLMVRSNRQLDIRMWIRAAAIGGLAIAFKNNGVVLLGTYGLLAGYIVVRYLIKKQPKLARRVTVYSAVGLPMMVIPWMLDVWHTMRYFDDPIGAFGEPRSIADFGDWGFFFRFDPTIFDNPWAFGPGEGSYWSLQYVTLHNDYYNHWNSASYLSWPADSVMNDVHRYVRPVERFDTAIVLQYIAIPITMVMVFAFLYSLYRVIFRPWYALRDGSVLIVIFAIMTQVAQLVRFIRYPDIHAVVIHARYMSFLYPFLLIVGVMWLWKLLNGRRVWQRIARPTMVQFYTAVSIAYAAGAFKLMWLPTHWK